MARKYVVLSLIFPLIVIAILLIVYLQVPESFKLYLLVAMAVSVLIGGAFLLNALVGKAALFQKKLRKAEHLVLEGTPETVKEAYLTIYNTYLKLPEKHKVKAYPRLVHLRETIEEQLRATKKVEKLLEQPASETSQQLQQRYDALSEQVATLPMPLQEKYYPQIVSLKEKLEKTVTG